ncbi:chloroperoxidase [Geosporobacter ferrireducens]|uniref:Chloroperoxidase n=2 Tax=Geosporobacter ferrireducens TaxID=1424294 RepID=A0A1D8GPU5_9FIRM|nr:chloroperoxidase [Geosporobacter ferrireducens]
MKKDYGNALPIKWSELAYAGEQRLPSPVEKNTNTWPTFFFYRNTKGDFLDHNGKPIHWEIRSPDSIDFIHEELKKVQNTLLNLTQEQITIAEYWNAGPPTKQFTPLIDRLIDTYDISAPRAARILGACNAAANDAMIITWHFKYLWDIPRPNQLDHHLATIICTPYHPSYPSGHSVVAGCMQILLSYFFSPESKRLITLAEECANSRLYGGVHFSIDNTEGLRLGRQIGSLIVNALSEQIDNNLVAIDYQIIEDKKAILPPPPYKQVISYPRDRTCSSLLDERQDPDAR